MTTITLKGIPEDLYRALKTKAKTHRRSLNGEILSALERTVGTCTLDPDEFLVRVDALRRRSKAPRLKEKDLSRAKENGRP